MTQTTASTSTPAFTGQTALVRVLFIGATAFAVLLGAILIVQAIQALLDKPSLSTLAGLAFMVCIGCTIGYFAIRKETESVRLTERVEEARREAAQHPDKSLPLWDSARARLELYFERNLSQVRSVFWAILGVMGVGLALVAYGVLQSLGKDSFVPTSIIAASAGALTELIGGTLLVIYRSTAAQSQQYVHTLERINAVGMALQVLDAIPERDAAKNQVRSDLAIQILTHAGPQPRA